MLLFGDRLALATVGYRNVLGAPDTDREEQNACLPQVLAGRRTFNI